MRGIATPLSSLIHIPQFFSRYPPPELRQPRGSNSSQGSGSDEVLSKEKTSSLETNPSDTSSQLSSLQSDQGSATGQAQTLPRTFGQTEPGFTQNGPATMPRSQGKAKGNSKFFLLNMD